MEKQSGRIRKKRRNYTQVSNVALRDNKLSLKAKGLFALINSFLDIPDFDLYKSFILKTCKEGRDAFNAAWEELKANGYLIQIKAQDEKGIFVYEYELVDDPGTGFPDVDNPDLDNPYANNTIQNNTVQNNTKSSSEDTVYMGNSTDDDDDDFNRFCEVLSELSEKRADKKVAAELYESALSKGISSHELPDYIQTCFSNSKVKVNNYRNFIKACINNYIPDRIRKDKLPNFDWDLSDEPQDLEQLKRELFRMA